MREREAVRAKESERGEARAQGGEKQKAPEVAGAGKQGGRVGRGKGVLAGQHTGPSERVRKRETETGRRQ